MKEECGLHLVAGRRKNSKAPLPGWLEYLRVHYRSAVETSYSRSCVVNLRSSESEAEALDQ